MMDLENLSALELLRVHVIVMDELRERKILRSANNPAGDLAEHIFSQAFGWQLVSASEKGFDAQDSKGRTYQIKARRPNRQGAESRQLSAIRSFGFDFLAGVLFDHFYKIDRAAIIPVDIVKRRARWQNHTNSHPFFLQDDVWAYGRR
ncbi:hypothetical protein NKDENANG_00548 [Candidatus Entotheonellaceae bacterium PAL068K]